VSANPPDFNPFQFVPKVADLTRLNRHPKVSFVVNEAGSIGNVKVLKGTGSRKVDASLVKSIQVWKYKAQPGCMVETSMVVVIDIGQQSGERRTAALLRCVGFMARHRLAVTDVADVTLNPHALNESDPSHTVLGVELLQRSWQRLVAMPRQLTQLISIVSSRIRSLLF